MRFFFFIFVIALLLPLPVFAATTAPIHGAVFSDLNKNGIKDAGEPPVPGVQIEIEPVSESRIFYSGVSNEQGDYSIFVPVPDMYDMMAVCLTGHFSSTCFQRLDIDMTQPGAGNGKTIDIPLPPQTTYFPVIAKGV